MAVVGSLVARYEQLVRKTGRLRLLLGGSLVIWWLKGLGRRGASLLLVGREVIVVGGCEVGDWLRCHGAWVSPIGIFDSARAC